MHQHDGVIAAPIHEAMETFLSTWLDNASSRRQYRYAITTAIEWMQVADFADLTGLRVAQWRSWLVERSSLSPSTASLRIAAMRSFLDWSRKVGLHALTRDIVEMTLRMPRATVVRPYEIVSPDDVRAMLAATKREGDRLIIYILVGSGLRVSEVSRLDAGDFHDEPTPWLHVRQGKGRKDRRVPVPAELAAMLRWHCKGRDADDPICVTESGWRAGQRLGPQGIQEMIARVRVRAGLNVRATCHALRHTYARRSMNHGADLVAVSRLLGHSNVSTTMRYVDHLSLEQLASVVPPLPA